MKGTSPSCTLHRHCSVKINEEERKINEEEKCNITSTSTILHRHCTVGLVKNSTEPSKNQEKTNLYLLLKKSQIPSENTAFRKFDKQYFVFFLYCNDAIVVVFAVNLLIVVPVVILVWLPLWSLYRQPLVKITPPESTRIPPRIPPVPVLRHSCQSQAIFLVEQWFIMMFLNWFNKWNQTRSFHAESLYSFNWLGSEELRVLVQILEIFVLANKTHLINLTHSRNDEKLITVTFVLPHDNLHS